MAKKITKKKTISPEKNDFLPEKYLVKTSTFFIRTRPAQNVDVRGFPIPYCRPESPLLYLRSLLTNYEGY